MAHDPAPASASLYGFAADCPPRDREPLFTLAWFGTTAALGAKGRGGTSMPIIPPQPSGKPLGHDGERRGLGCSPAHGGAGSMILRKDQSDGEAERSADPPTRQGPPSPGGQCSAPENTLEGEGSTVLHRTVRRRRRWSEALAEEGPSIPLPSTRNKRSRRLPSSGTPPLSDHTSDGTMFRNAID